MKKPIPSDYSTTGNMTNPYGSYDYEKYSVDMKIYAEYLESKLSEPTIKEETSKENLNIPDVRDLLIGFSQWLNENTTIDLDTIKQYLYIENYIKKNNL